MFYQDFLESLFDKNASLHVFSKIFVAGGEGGGGKGVAFESMLWLYHVVLDVFVFLSFFFHALR